MTQTASRPIPELGTVRGGRRITTDEQPARAVWRAALFDTGDEFTQEQGQGMSRVIIAAMASVVFFFIGHFSGVDAPFLVAVSYLLGGVLYLSFVTRHKHRYAWRRYVVILLDLGVVTYVTAYFANAGVAIYPLFLWIIVGNGIRYGERHMQFATLSGLLGFSGALASNGYIAAQPGTYIGLMLGLVLIPKFFLIMIERLAEANVRLQAQRDAAEYMATHDVLTGLPNRAYLYTRLQQALARARRNHHELTVAFIDIDGFKSINDSFGHEYGDKLLEQVAQTMKGAVRESDTVARTGSDEFVVVIEDSDEGPSADVLIERLFTCVGRYYAIGDCRTYLTWSCGIVVYPRDGDTTDTLLKHADTAMHEAKTRGQNHFVFYDPSMSASVSEQLALRDELRGALADDELEVYYQPIIDARTGSVSSAEALLRWHHPERGTLSPAAFIGVAERSGLINDIGRWVVAEALDVAAQWRARVDLDVSMHVNVSAQQLRHDDFVDEIDALIRRSGLPPSVLDLEVTESVLLEDDMRAEVPLAALQGRGVRIALDDFGTGYSSLSYLKRLPVDTIKVDKSFIDEIPGNRRDCALVDAVLTLGDRLEHAIVAEGVETAEQRDWLVTHGCRYLQGYLFSRPVPRDEFLDLAKRRFDTTPSVISASGG